MKKLLNIYTIIYTIVLIIMSLSMISCSYEDKTTRCYVCNQQERLNAAEFVSNNVKNANNMSDEEMEDVISELRKTGIKLYCRQEFIPTTHNGNIKWSEIKRDSLDTYYPYIY